VGVAHGPLRDARRFPSTRWYGTRTTLGFWDLSIVHGPFSVAPSQTLALRFATVASQYEADGRQLMPPDVEAWMTAGHSKLWDQARGSRNKTQEPSENAGPLRDGMEVLKISGELLLGVVGVSLAVSPSECLSRCVSRTASLTVSPTGCLSLTVSLSLSLFRWATPQTHCS
jgi:hypothetical protein